MTVAVVMTIKNEERLLKNNVLYHLGIGISKIFVYLDGTTDSGSETLKGIKGVEIQNSIKADTYKNLSFLEKFWSQAAIHHTARQCLNTYDALQKCKINEIDWLISLDADELFLTDKDELLTLQDFFESAARLGADVINLRPLEVIARKLAYQNVMLEETMFKTQKNFQSKFDQIYQKIYNPYNNSYKTVPYWLGHTMGKAALKVNGDVVPHNVHRYLSIEGKPLKTVSMGYLLHYHTYDFEDFIKKYQNFKERSDTYLSGNKIDDLKSLWIKMVNDPNHTFDYLKSYYEKNLLFDLPKMNRLKKTRFGNIIKRKESAVISVDLPKHILIGALENQEV